MTSGWLQGSTRRGRPFALASTLEDLGRILTHHGENATAKPGLAAAGNTDKQIAENLSISLPYLPHASAAPIREARSQLSSDLTRLGQCR